MFEGLLLVLPLLMPARAPPKCGCCGEAGHNRRNCPHLARIREQQGNDNSMNGSAGGGIPPVERHAAPSQIPGMRLTTSEVQGPGVDEPEAVALAVARSMQPGSEPQDEPDEPVEGEAAESDGSGEEEQGEPARYRGSEY